MKTYAQFVRYHRAEIEEAAQHRRRTVAIWKAFFDMVEAGVIDHGTDLVQVCEDLGIPECYRIDSQKIVQYCAVYGT